MNYTDFHKISLKETRKVSACFHRLHVCDVIQFRDDHARMRIRGPLAQNSNNTVNCFELLCPT